MAQPLLARLREQSPGATIDALAPPWVAPVLRRMPELDEVIEADLRHGALQLAERWRLGRRLRGRAYDRSLVLPNSWKSALVPFLAAIPRRIGYRGEARYGLLNVAHREVPVDAPMALRYARLAEPPGAEPTLPLPQPRLRVAPEALAAALRKFGLAARYAALCPGAEYGPAKRWPRFAELAAQLALPTVLLGSAADREACAGVPGTNLAGRTTLDEAIEIIAGAAFVVSNDSGLMHVAAALGTPQVALFGSSSPRRTPPQSTRARVVWLGLECSPCYARECPLGHFRCMREMSVERVLAEIEKAQQAGSDHVFRQNGGKTWSDPDSASQ